MKALKYLFLILALFTEKIWSSERNVARTDFVISFLRNEITPPILILNGLCWGKREEVNLIIEISKAGYKSAYTLNTLKVCERHHLVFLIDANCSGIEVVMDNAAKNKLFTAPYRWLVLMNSSQNMDLLSNLPLYTDSDLVFAKETDYGYEVIELHKPSSNISMQTALRGFYNGSFFDVRLHKEMFKRRRDLMGHPLIMSNVVQESNKSHYHLPREDWLDAQNDAIPKICWSNVKLAFQMLNATPRYIFNPSWGYQSDGKWDGMIDDLLSDRAVIGTNCLVSEERLKVIQYVDSVVEGASIKFIFRQPPLSYTSSNIFALPFSRSVWMAILVCAAVYIATLSLASKWEIQFGKSSSQPDGRITDAWFLAMAALAQQGCFFEPRYASGRIMLWVFFTALMALYAAYCANIVVLLQATSDIKTIEQLVNSKITLAANDVDLNRYWLKFYKDPISLLVLNRIEPDHGKQQYYNFSEGVEKIRQGMFAFHYIVEPVYRRIEESFLETEKCDLVEVDLLNDLDPFLPAKKDSPYLELLRVVLKQIRESGIKRALISRMQVPKPRCSKTVSVYNSVGFIDMRPVLIFMLLGIAVSIGILLVEIVVHKVLVSVLNSSGNIG